MLRAASLGSVPRLLAASAVAVSVTGTVNETALATISIPAGVMGLNGAIEVRTVWSGTSSANTKTYRVRLGGAAGTAHMTLTPATTSFVGDVRRIRNRNSASSQVGSSSGALSGGFGGAGTAITTSAIDTSVAVDLVISGQLALGTETITLESYEVWILP